MAILHDGTTVNMGGKDYVLPPLTLRSLKALGPKIASLSELSGMPDADQVDAMVEVIHASAVRNYPDLTPDDLLDVLDLKNLKDVFPAVMAASGMVKRDSQGEVVGPKD